MTTREQTEAIVALLQQGLSSAEIAEQLYLTPPVVWGVKAHWRQGKYGDAPGSPSSEQITADDGEHKMKATAILSGYLKLRGADNRADDPATGAAPEFARLLALITSSKMPLRDAARKEVREYAIAGGWHARPQKTANSRTDIKEPTEAGPKKKRPNRWRKWRDEDHALLLDTWNGRDSNKDGASIAKLSEILERSPLALVIRLYRAPPVPI